MHGGELLPGPPRAHRDVPPAAERLGHQEELRHAAADRLRDQARAGPVPWGPGCGSRVSPSSWRLVSSRQTTGCAASYGSGIDVKDIFHRERRTPGPPSARNTIARPTRASPRFFERLPHRFIRNRFHDLEPHQFVGQQPETSSGLGRPAGCCRSQSTALPPPRPGSGHRSGPAACGQVAARPCSTNWRRTRSTVLGLTSSARNGRIRPAWTALAVVGLEQDAGAGQHPGRGGARSHQAAQCRRAAHRSRTMRYGYAMAGSPAIATRDDPH